MRTPKVLILFFILFFSIVENTVFAQKELLKRTLKSCCAKGLTSKEFCKEYKSIKTDSLKITKLDILADIVQKLNPDYEDFSFFAAGEYEARKSDSNFDENAYLIHIKATEKFIWDLLKSGVINRESKDKLLQLVDTRKILHPTFAAQVAALCVVKEELQASETTEKIYGNLKEFMKEKNYDYYDRIVAGKRASLWDILVGLEYFSKVSKWKYMDVQKAAQNFKSGIVYNIYDLDVEKATGRFNVDTIYFCGGIRFGLKRFVIETEGYEMPIAFSCPYEEVDGEVKIKAAELYKSRDWRGLITQIMYDEHKHKRKVFFIDPIEIAETFLAEKGFYYSFSHFPEINLYYPKYKGWYRLEKDRYDKLTSKKFTTRNGWKFDFLNGQKWDETDRLDSKTKWAIYDVMEKSGALDRYPLGILSQWTREYGHEPIQDTLEALNQFNLLSAFRLKDFMQSDKEIFENNESILLFDYLSAISWYDFQIDSFRIEKDGKSISAIYYSFIDDKKEFKTTKTTSFELMGQVIRDWYSLKERRRKFYSLPGTQLPYLLFLSKEEAYHLQESLNYLIVPF